MLKSDPRLYAEQTHNYTGEQGLNDSPWMPVCLDFRGLAKGHRPLSERGIIAAKTARSTNNFNYLGSVAIVTSSTPKAAVPGYLKALNPVVKIPVSAGI